MRNANVFRGRVAAVDNESSDTGRETEVTSSAWGSDLITPHKPVTRVRRKVVPTESRVRRGSMSGTRPPDIGATLSVDMTQPTHSIRLHWSLIHYSPHVSPQCIRFDITLPPRGNVRDFHTGNEWGESSYLKLASRPALDEVRSL